MESIRNYINTEKIICHADTRVAEVKYLLKKYNYDEMVVLESESDNTPIGLISLKDMESVYAEHADLPSDVTTRECMRAIPAVVEENSSLDESLNIMRRNDINEVPVVTMNGGFVGIIQKKRLLYLVK